MLNPGISCDNDKMSIVAVDAHNKLCQSLGQTDTETNMVASIFSCFCCQKCLFAAQRCKFSLNLSRFSNNLRVCRAGYAGPRVINPTDYLLFLWIGLNEQLLVYLAMH